MDEMMMVRGWAHTDIGRVREVNQDSHFVEPTAGIFAVADGVGGRKNGDVASKVLVEMLRGQADTIGELAGASDPVENMVHRERVLDILSGQVQRANAEIFRIGEGEMATTAVVLVVSGNAAYIAHVGDSRVYLMRDDRVMRLTNDHTFAEKLREERRRKGDVGGANLAQFEHVLTRSVGTRPQVDVDTIFMEVQPGDRFVLCSDGVSDRLTGGDMSKLLESHRDDEGPAALIDEAMARGSTDNLTAVVVDVAGTAGGMGDETSFAETEPLDTMRKVSFLEQIALFEGLQAQELLRVMRVIDKIHYCGGEKILERGAEVDSLYLIVSGEVSLQVDGTEVARLHAGAHFGELALYGQERRSADAIAVGEVHVLAIQADRFRKLVEVQAPELGNKLLRNLLVHASDRIRSTTEQLVDGE